MLRSCASCGASPTNYATHWWNDAVFYEVFVRSFHDSNGDGIGDFEGLTAEARLPQRRQPGHHHRPGRHGPLADAHDGVAELPRLRRDRLPGHRARLRHHGRLRGVPGRRPRARHQGHHRPGAEPLLRAAPLVSAGRQQRHQPLPRLVPLVGHQPGLPGPWGQTVWHPRNGSYYYGMFWSGMPDLNWRQPRS